jgi:hypothetical protein
VIEELFEIDVHHPPAPFLYVSLRGAYGIVRAAPRSEAVAVLRERWVESWLQYLQNALLDESVDDGRYPELSDATAVFGNSLPSHGLRSVGPREQLCSKALSLPRYVRRQIFHRHPVDAGAALVLLHPPKRRFDVAAFDDEAHEILAVVS